VAAVSERFTPADVAKQLDYCTFCPKMCRHACPVSTTTGRETLIPQAKMDRLNKLRSGVEEWKTETTDPLWGCTGCRHCTVYCDHGNEPGLVLLAGRAEAQRRGVAHPALAGYAERFRARDERLARQGKERFGTERFAETGQVGFWPGCDTVDKGAADVAAAFAVFDRVGAEHVKLVDAGLSCAGYPLLAAGLTDLFRWHAGKVASALRRFRTVVINCSACLYSLRSQYDGEGVTVGTEVLSLAEYMAQHASRLPTPAVKKSVFYHDPCYLARYAGVIEPPRRVLGQIATVREFGWSRQDTECCGGGGLLPKTAPSTADAMARRRLAEVAAAGGGTVVTSCGTCAFMLRRNAPASVEVADLPTAIAQLTETPVEPLKPQLDDVTSG
jgi:fumarate reductase (CoM/CoB) subunit B